MGRTSERMYNLARDGGLLHVIRQEDENGMSDLVKAGGHELVPTRKKLPVFLDIEEFKKAHEFRYPPVFKPYYRVMMGDTAVELWVSPRRMPLMMARPNGAMIVPVSSDLKMVFGAAKMARDYGASRVQREAERVAPLQPGEAFVGSGGRYRFRWTALAVIFDETKRTSPGIIRQAIRSAAQQVYERGATSIILPDFSENIMPQPNWITSQKKRQVTQAVAAMMMEAVRACKGTVKTIKLWVWEIDSLDFYLREMKRLEAGR